jgi:hypothetical protein
LRAGSGPTVEETSLVAVAVDTLRHDQGDYCWCFDDWRERVIVGNPSKEALIEQRKAFIDKFGREPGSTDPVFFDPYKDVPTPLSGGRLESDLESALRDSGTDRAKAQAILKLLR